MIDNLSSQVSTGEVFRIVQETNKKVDRFDEKVDNLTKAVSELVAVNHRLDEHKVQLRDHEVRVTDLEIDMSTVKTSIKPRTPWYSAVAGVVGIVTGVVSAVALFSFIVKIGSM